MAVFDTLGISGSGLMVHRKWLDAVSDNIANVNTVNPYDEDAVPGAAHRGPGRRLRLRRGRRPRRPGRVRRRPRDASSTSPTTRWPTRRATSGTPTSTWATRWSQLIMAQRGYQANLAVVERATNAYQAALQLGKG